jgi:hypothetical protein
LAQSAALQEAALLPEGGVDFDAEIQRLEVSLLNAALRRTGGGRRRQRACCVWMASASNTFAASIRYEHGLIINPSRFYF